MLRAARARVPTWWLVLARTVSTIINQPAEDPWRSWLQTPNTAQPRVASPAWTTSHPGYQGGRGQYQQHSILYHHFHIQNTISNSARCQVNGKLTISHATLWKHQVWNTLYLIKIIILVSIRGHREKSSYTHKSMSCMAEDAGLISQDSQTLVTPSPSHTRYQPIRTQYQLVSTNHITEFQF